MTSTPEVLRRGWCPGALRPMQSGDGFIVRLKPSCGVLRLDQAKQIASLADRHGNGVIELTSRGNLQLRGVREATLAELTRGLDELGLVDASPQAEARRNVIGSPLAGLDATAFDTRSLVHALEGLLIGADHLEPLSDKFGFLIDGGGRLPLSDVEADIRFAWTGHGFAVGLASQDGVLWDGVVPSSEVPRTALALAEAFLLHGAGAGRMRLLDDVQRLAVMTVVKAAANGDAAVPAPNLPVGKEERFVAVALPYGATTSQALLALLEQAGLAGVRDIRLSPWRTLFFVLGEATAPDVAQRLLQDAQLLGFITEPRDPRRAIAACPGAPACANGSTPVRADADGFAAAAEAALVAGLRLHVSGCVKGCACRTASQVTLVADQGRYGVVVNGTAGDPVHGAFTRDEIGEALARLAKTMTQARDWTADRRTAAIQAAFKETSAA